MPDDHLGHGFRKAMHDSGMSEEEISRRLNADRSYFDALIGKGFGEEEPIQNESYNSGGVAMVELRNEDLPKSLFEQMEGYQPPKDFVSNGCSCAPDEYGGVDLRPACHFHDWMYHIGGCKRNRKGADQMFYRNLVRCGLSPKMAGVYYRRVRLWGVKAFRWSKGCEPVRPWCYISLFFSRYLTW